MVGVIGMHLRCSVRLVIEVVCEFIAGPRGRLRYCLPPKLLRKHGCCRRLQAKQREPDGHGLPTIRVGGNAISPLPQLANVRSAWLAAPHQIGMAVGKCFASSPGSDFRLRRWGKEMVGV
jgi:hypothetical protein